MAFSYLQRLTQQAASALNAAGWKNLSRGAIAAVSGILTATDAVFSAEDVGKKIYVDGAGSAGTILEAEITGFTNPTTVTIAPAASLTVVGATVSYGGQLQDDRRNLFEIREAIFEGDEAHYLAIAETKGHWRRPAIMTLSGEFSHGAELSLPHIGPLGRVFIQTGPLDAYQPGKRAEAEEIERLRANLNNVYGALAHNVAGSHIGGHFWMPADENLINFTGSKAKVYYVPAYTRAADDLQSPTIYGGSIVSFAVARLLAKEGAKTPTHATIHGSYSEAVLAGIRANQMRVPTLEEFQQEIAVGRKPQ